MMDKIENSNKVYLTIDTAADVATLPTEAKNGIAPGSTAFCVATSQYYMLGHDDAWHAVKM